MFFAVDFTIFLRAAGIVITSIDQLQQSLPRWAKRKYIPFLDDVKNVIAQPLSLQTACSIAVRERVNVEWASLARSGSAARPSFADDVRRLRQHVESVTE